MVRYVFVATMSVVAGITAMAALMGHPPADDNSDLDEAPPVIGPDSVSLALEDGDGESLLQELRNELLNPTDEPTFTFDDSGDFLRFLSQDKIGYRTGILEMHDSVTADGAVMLQATADREAYCANAGISLDQDGLRWRVAVWECDLDGETRSYVVHVCAGVSSDGEFDEVIAGMYENWSADATGTTCLHRGTLPMREPGFESLPDDLLDELEHGWPSDEDGP